MSETHLHWVGFAQDAKKVRDAANVSGKPS